MRDQIELLRRTAVALRDLAARAPLIADALRRLANELDAEADQLERDRGAP